MAKWLEFDLIVFPTFVGDGFDRVVASSGVPIAVDGGVAHIPRTVLERAIGVKCTRSDGV